MARKKREVIFVRAEGEVDYVGLGEIIARCVSGGDYEGYIRRAMENQQAKRLAAAEADRPHV
jgi:hypothetical protein